MILVVGATGYLGGMIVRKLLDRGSPVRAMVRPQSDPKALEHAGAETVRGDLKDPASLDRACVGVTTVITTANSVQRGGADTVDSVDLTGNLNLIDAARRAGVGHFIFVSVAGAEPSSEVPLFAAKARVEKHLRDSGMKWTIVAPHVFMEVWFPMIVGNAVRAERPVPLVGSGKARHSFISAADVAEFAVAAALQPAARNQRLTVGGPAALSWTEVVASSAKIVGHEIPVQSLQPGQPIPGLPSPQDQVIGFLMAGLEQHDVVLDSSAIAETLGVSLTPADKVLRGILA